MMTAYATIDDAVEAMRLGAIDYMAKPFAPEVLLNMVSRYLPENPKKPTALLLPTQRVFNCWSLQAG